MIRRRDGGLRRHAAVRGRIALGGLVIGGPRRIILEGFKSRGPCWLSWSRRQRAGEAYLFTETGWIGRGFTDVQSVEKVRMLGGGRGDDRGGERDGGAEVRVLAGDSEYEHG